VPEGDTIFRTARALQQGFASHTVTSFETAYAPLASVHDQSPVTGRVIERGQIGHPEHRPHRVPDQLVELRPGDVLAGGLVGEQPIGVDAVRRVIRDAYRRIGLTHGRTHALRHTVASRLLDRGGSLKEVADVLRHRSLNTSLIYAKLDQPRLAAVALPWPGSAT